MESVDVPRRQEVEAEVRADPLLEQQMDELRERGREATPTARPVLRYHW